LNWQTSFAPFATSALLHSFGVVKPSAQTAAMGLLMATVHEGPFPAMSCSSI
jgi:hypothetical protein